MEPPLWKKWLSYLWEWHVESASSELNPHLHVSLKNGRYQLSTANAVYSYGDLYDNFVKAFQRVPLNELPGREVLILGFGLGSIPVILEHKLNRNYYYTAIEADEAVIDLASRYTLPTLQSNIQLICADAFTYIMQSDPADFTYDLICVDIFEDDKVPDIFETPDFLGQLRALLSPGGLLLFNRLAVSPADIQQTRDFYHNSFLSVFPEGAYLDVDGNWILLSEGNWLQKRPKNLG